MKFLTMPQIRTNFLYLSLLLTFLFDCALGQVEESDRNGKLKFIPSHYEIEIRIGVEEGEKWEVDTSPGKVKITGRMLKDQLDFGEDNNGTESTTSSIYLDIHSRSLQISNDSIVVSTVTGNSIEIDEVGEEKDGEVLIIQLGRDLVPQEELEVSLEYTVKIMPYLWNTVKNGSNIRSHMYQTESGKNSTYYSTLTSANDYQLFPCVYDLDLLSTFEVTIFKKENYTTISNTEVISSLPDPENPGWVQDKFQITPPMPLDSLAFFVSDFPHAERKAEDGMVIRVHGPKFILDKHERGNFTAAAAASIVDFYGGYFNDTSIPKGHSKTYPVRTIDIVWTSGEPPMEKPGIISYSGGYSDSRRWDLPSWTKERHNQLKTLEVIGPLLQQWFLPFTSALNGYRMWSFPKPKQPLKFLYIYLKELGMSSISSEYLWNGTLGLRMLCTQEYGLVTTYFHDNYELCYEQLVDDASRWIGSIFSTMRMLADENLLGKEVVRQATLELRRKLEEASASGKRIVEDDKSVTMFLESLQEVARRKNRIPEHINISQVLESWDRQIGDYRGGKEAKRYLIVRVDIVNDTHLSFTQERIHGRLADEGSENVKWFLPVTIQTAEGLHYNLWLENHTDFVLLPVNHTKSKWIMVNPNSTSIHRTIYHPHLLQKLQTQLISNHTVFNPSARIRLMDDYFHFLHLKSYSGSPYKDSENFTLFGSVNVPGVLNLTRYLDQEDSLLVWINLIQSLDYLSYSPRINYASLYPPHPGIQNLNNYFRPKLNSVLKTIQVKDMHRHPKALLILEAQLLRTACQMGNPICLEYAKIILKQWKESPDLFTFNERLPPIKELLGMIVMGGGEEGFDFAIRWFFNNKDGTPRCQANSYRRNKVLTALTYSRKSALLQKLLNLTMYNSTITCGSHQPSDSLEFVAGRMSQTLDGAELYRKFFYENCDRIVKSYPYLVKGTTNILKLIPNIHTEAQYDELESFVQRRPTCLNIISKEKLGRELDYYQENVRKFQEWMNHTGTGIFSWFADFSQPPLTD